MHQSSTFVDCYITDNAEALKTRLMRNDEVNHGGNSAAAAAIAYFRQAEDVLLGPPQSISIISYIT